MNNSIDIKPMDMAIDKTKYEKLEIGRSEMIKIIEPFIRQLPDIILDKAYTFTLPTSMSELLNNVTDSRHLLVNLINSDGASNILSLVKLRPSVIFYFSYSIYQDGYERPWFQAKYN